MRRRTTFLNGEGRGDSQSPLVSVVVVSYNGRALLPACLESLRAQTYPNREILLVDNASTDDSVAWTRVYVPEARIIQNSVNLGFAGGANAGIRAAWGEVIATLNTDAVADPRWLEEAVAALGVGSDVGMVASRVVFAHCPEIVESAGIEVNRAGVAWDRLNGAAIGDAEAPADVFGPSGCAAFYRRAMLDDVGWFDDAFFMYFEDVDLAWRAQLAGWRCAYAPGARVAHQHSATAGASSAFKHYLLARNRVRLIARNYPALLLGLYLPAIVGYDCAVVVAALVWRRFAPKPARLAAIRGRLDGLRELPSALRARGAIQRRRRVSIARFRRLLLPLSSPGAFYRRARRARNLTRAIPREGSVELA